MGSYVKNGSGHCCAAQISIVELQTKCRGEVTHVAAGSAVMSPPHQSVERLLALHAHGDFIVADPSRRSFPQLRRLQAHQRQLTETRRGKISLNQMKPVRRNTCRHFPHFFQRVLERLVLLLEDLNGLLEGLKPEHHSEGQR